MGALTLTVGTGIFLIWWAARDWFAVSLMNFEVYGFFWILIATPVALIALILILYTLGNNYPKFLGRTLGSLVLILINFPALLLILEKLSDIDSRAYVNLTNRTKSDIIELTLSASTFTQELGTLDRDKSVVADFHPLYLNDRRESVPLVDTVLLLIRTQEKQYETILPDAYKGSC